MARPTSYNRQYSFQSFQQQQPNTPLPADQVDGEFNRVKLAFDSVIAALSLIQRDDGLLKNGSVGLDQLSAEITVGFQAPSWWASGVDYLPGNTVFQSGSFYFCLEAHNSTEFASDLSAGRWRLIANLTQFILDDIPATMNVDVFTGDGAETAFSLSVAPASKNNVIPVVAGTIVPLSDYEISGSTIQFATAPGNGDPVEVRSIVLVSEVNAVGGGSVVYANTNSPLSSDNVQDAIDELAAEIAGLNTGGVISEVNSLKSRVQDAETDIVALQTGKADLSHSHPAGQITGLGDLAVMQSSSLPALKSTTTSGWRVPVGTTAQRPTGSASDLRGTIRFNSTTGEFEGHNGSNWVNLKGSF